MIDVGSLDEFPEESIRIVSIGSREIGIVRWHGDSVYAMHSRCPHMAGPLCLGALGPHLEGAPGDVDAIDVPVIACPWHHWEFDVRDGRSLSGGSARARTYAVSVEDGRVFVELAHRAG